MIAFTEAVDYVAEIEADRAIDAINEYVESEGFAPYTGDGVPEEIREMVTTDFPFYAEAVFTNGMLAASPFGIERPCFLCGGEVTGAPDVNFCRHCHYTGAAATVAVDDLMDPIREAFADADYVGVDHLGGGCFGIGVRFDRDDDSEEYALFTHFEGGLGLDDVDEAGMPMSTMRPERAEWCGGYYPNADSEGEFDDGSEFGGRTLADAIAEVIRVRARWQGLVPVTVSRDGEAEATNPLLTPEAFGNPSDDEYEAALDVVARRGRFEMEAESERAYRTGLAGVAIARVILSSTPLVPDGASSAYDALGRILDDAGHELRSAAYLAAHDALHAAGLTRDYRTLVDDAGRRIQT